MAKYCRVDFPITLGKIDKALEFANQNNMEVCVNVKNTMDITNEGMKILHERYGNKVKIRVEGAYDDQIINELNSVDFFKYDNVYDLVEIRMILSEINKIEKGIDKTWNDEQKLMYFIGYLSNNIIYHPLCFDVESKDIRSLRGLYSHQTVCAGYSLILQELCDRNGVKCHYAFGATTQVDSDKGINSHAWNIVELGGNLVGIDLTWIARKSRSGHFLSVEDISNVNDFANSHYPNKYCDIQDYKNNLKSIDGMKLLQIYKFVNKNINYYNTGFSSFRKNDNSKYVFTLVNQKVVDEHYIYTYIYQNRNDDGSLGAPVVVYSKTNVAELMVLSWQKKYLLHKKLEKAIKYDDKDNIENIRKKIDELPPLEKMGDIIGNLLFSRENLIAAQKRGDYYIGEVVYDDETGKVSNPIIDLDFANKIRCNQKYFFRDDKSSFVIEGFSNKLICNGKTVYAYKLYENILDDGRKVIRKNTIFTDEDLFGDDRKEIPNKLLTRYRIDRKEYEHGGYMGSISKDGEKIVHDDLVHYFSNKISNNFILNNNDFIDYVPELSFERVRRLIENYEYSTINGQTIIVNRNNRQMLNDEIMIKQFKFANLWLKSAGIKVEQFEKIPGYNFAFNNFSKQIFDVILSSIKTSINKYGDIDILDIITRVKKNKDIEYEYTDTLLFKLFDNTYGSNNLSIIREAYRLENPSAFLSSDINKDNNIISVLYSNKSIDKNELEIYEDDKGNIGFKNK